MKDRTTAKPSKEITVFRQCKINDYEAMIKETLEAMDKVLEQRKKDLDVWGEKEKNEFFTIFGIKGESIVHIDMPRRGVTSLVRMKAIDVMKDCINRLQHVRGTMGVSNFVNKINEPHEVCAKVVGEPQDNYLIEIGINFVGRRKRGNNSDQRICLQVTGRDSRVATLCHELSHIPKKFSDPSQGGMGTSDYDSKGIRQSPYQEDKDSYKQHVAGATKLVNEGNELVFDNAYNIERYFEIEI